MFWSRRIQEYPRISYSSFSNDISNVENIRVYVTGHAIDYKISLDQAMVWCPFSVIWTDYDPIHWIKNSQCRGLCCDNKMIVECKILLICNQTFEPN